MDIVFLKSLKLSEEEKNYICRLFFHKEKGFLSNETSPIGVNKEYDFTQDSSADWMLIEYDEFYEVYHDEMFQWVFRGDARQTMTFLAECSCQGE